MLKLSRLGVFFFSNPESSFIAAFFSLNSGRHIEDSDGEGTLHVLNDNTNKGASVPG